MLRVARAPPVVGMALAAGCGAALHHLGVPIYWTPLLPLAPLLLNRTSKRPDLPLAALGLAVVAGFALASTGDRRHAGDCRLGMEEGKTIQVSGWLMGPLVDGKGEFVPVPETASECAEPLRLVVPGAWGARQGGSALVQGPWGDLWAPGAFLAIRGSWRKGRPTGNTSPYWAGYLRVESVETPTVPAKWGLRGLRAAVGGWVQARVADLFPRSAALANALVWARKEGIDPETREAFVRAGVAHLLAISGFHVGVVAGILLSISGLLGLSHPVRFLLSSVGVWCYVAAIGLPGAATRAAILVSVLALGRKLDRPVVRLGGLATAFLGFLAVDPGSLTGPGFQLSFAGALGLVVGYRPVLARLTGAGKGRIPRVVLQGLAAGVAATAATLPLVAWHFGRVSIIGIPMTLVVAPLVVLVIPGIFFCLLLSVAFPGWAAFFGLGVDLALQMARESVLVAAALPFASIRVPPGTALVGCLALLVVWVGISVRGRSGGRRFIQVAGFAVLVGIVLGRPAVRLVQRGSMEIVVLDVGQGDATLIRSPGGRWLLVDAGPRTRGFDAGEETVVPYLEDRGVDALDLMILTHPDMDHVGGAPSVLGMIQVGKVMDPGVAAGTQVFLDALEVAQERGVPWTVGQVGDSLDLDGVAIRVLAPEEHEVSDALGGRGSTEGTNDRSLVLEVRYGGFAALLLGDAPAASEVRLIPRILSPRVQLLKIGHHGSTTSSTPALLDRSGADVALISVGRRNRFGHPDPDVLQRIRDRDMEVVRTDEAGDVRVLVRKDGSFRIRRESG